jgi:transposase-like protein
VKHCRRCGEELTFVVRDTIESSDFYICKNCNTLWDYLDDKSLNQDVVIDVDSYLKEIYHKKVAS